MVQVERSIFPRPASLVDEVSGQYATEPTYRVRRFNADSGHACEKAIGKADQPYELKARVPCLPAPRGSKDTLSHKTFPSRVI
jgi:hypothetical protein